MQKNGFPETQLLSMATRLRAVRMNLTDELRKLAELHAAGHLNDSEFAAAKHRLLADGPAEPGVATSTVPTTVSVQERRADIPERTYRSSRWSSGNFFFPDSLTMAPDGMLFRKRSLFGSSEEHIDYGAVASFRVRNGIFLSDLSIETAGGSQPIFVNGLWKSATREIQDTLRQAQGAVR